MTNLETFKKILQSIKKIINLSTSLAFILGILIGAVIFLPPDQKGPIIKIILKIISDKKPPFPGTGV